MRMGLLRILLAVCVFSSHASLMGNWLWLRADIAVELFFVISGFYMQLVLTKRYTEKALGKAWTLNFYAARYLKLFPVYSAAAFLALVAALLDPTFAPVSVWKFIWALPDTINNIFSKIFMTFTNMTIFFQDATMFLAVKDDQISWSGNFRESVLPLWQGLLIPQAWSLGVELSFYIIAPYLLNLRSRWLIIGSCLCLLIKVVVVQSFHLQDPWTYRFFPFELGYFLLGALAYRYRSTLDGLFPGRLGIYSVYLIVIFICALKIPIYPKYIWYPLALACCLPFFFKKTSGLKVDRLIGELSYPFYIFHLLAIESAAFAVRNWFHGAEGSIAWAGLGLTLILSSVALALETYFIEPWRGRLAEPRSLESKSKTRTGQVVEEATQ